MQKTWSQKFRTFKSSLRPILETNNPIENVPKGMDPHTWRKFVENESDPKKKEQKPKNRDRRKKIKFSHCLGRRSYAQKQYLMVCIITFTFHS